MNRSRCGAVAWLIVLTTGMWMLGCKPKENAYVPPPPPEVVVARPVQRTVTRYLEYTGSTTGVETVELRARVKGFLAQMHFSPGSLVNAGDLLFTIDQRTFEVAVAAAEADLAGKKAAADIIEVQYRKAQELLAKNAATQLEVDEWKAKRDQALAARDYAKATLDGAKLDLEFTQVRSPIKGIVGVNQVDLGTLVGASDPTLLTTVIRQDEIYAYVDVSERDILMMTSRRVAQGQPTRAKRMAPMQLGMANEPGYPHAGLIDFADNTVNPQTGTLQVRAVFANPRNELLPGLFVRLRAPFDSGTVMLVPDAAVQQDQGGRYVLVVNSSDEVERRAVVAGKAIGQLRPIESGLGADDRVIVTGVLRTRPGGKVTPRASEIDPSLLPPDTQATADALVPSDTTPPAEATASPQAPGTPN